MSDLFYVYIASGVFFLLIEMFTAAFYGLAVSIACFILALYIYFTGDTLITVPQGFILVAVSGILAYFLPKYMISKTEPLKSGLDVHVGSLFRLEQVGSDWKIKIDGVDYLINDDSITPDFEVGRKVRLDGHKSGVLVVSLVK